MQTIEQINWEDPSKSIRILSHSKMFLDDLFIITYQLDT